MPHMSKQVIFASTADFELLLKQVRKQYAASSKMQLGIPYPILTLFIPAHSLTNLFCSSRSLVARPSTISRRRQGARRHAPAAQVRSK